MSLYDLEFIHSHKTIQKTMKNGILWWVSTEPGEKNEGQLASVTPATETLCTNHYLYRKMNKYKH